MSAKNWRPNFAVMSLTGINWLYEDCRNEYLKDYSSLEWQFLAQDIFKTQPDCNLVVRIWPTNEGYSYEVLQRERGAHGEMIESRSVAYDPVGKMIIRQAIKAHGYAPKLPVDESAMEPVTI